MNLTMKRVLAIGCTLAALGAWVPLFFTGDEGPRSAPPDMPAQPAPAATGAEAGAIPNDGARPTAIEPGAASSDDHPDGATTAPRKGSPARGLAELQSSLTDSPGGGTEALLERLSRAWSNDESARAAEPTPRATEAPPAPTTAPHPLPTESLQPTREAPATVDPVGVFLEAHPLRGALVSSTLRTALLGDAVVREGDVLAGGALVVRSIDARAVVFARGETELRVELAPFAPLPPRASSAITPGPAGVPAASRGAAPADAAPAAPPTNPAAGSAATPEAPKPATNEKP